MAKKKQVSKKKSIKSKGGKIVKKQQKINKKPQKKTVKKKKEKPACSYCKFRSRIWVKFPEYFTNYYESAKAASYIYKKFNKKVGKISLVRLEELVKEWKATATPKELKLKAYFESFPYYELDEKMKEVQYELKNEDVYDLMQVRSKLSRDEVFYLSGYNYDDTFKDYTDLMNDQYSGTPSGESPLLYMKLLYDNEIPYLYIYEGEPDEDMGKGLSGIGDLIKKTEAEMKKMGARDLVDKEIKVGDYGKEKEKAIYKKQEIENLTRLREIFKAELKEAVMDYKEALELGDKKGIEQARDNLILMKKKKYETNRALGELIRMK